MLHFVNIRRDGNGTVCFNDEVGIGMCTGGVLAQIPKQACKAAAQLSARLQIAGVNVVQQLDHTDQRILSSVAPRKNWMSCDAT